MNESVMESEFCLIASVDRESDKISIIFENDWFKEKLGKADTFTEMGAIASDLVDFEYKAPFSRIRILNGFNEKRSLVFKSELDNWYRITLYPVGDKQVIITVVDYSDGFNAFLKSSRKKVNNTASVIHDLFKSNYVFAFIVYPKSDKIIYYVFNGEKELVEVPEDRSWTRTYGDYGRTLHPDDRQRFYEATHFGDFTDMKENDQIEVIFRSMILEKEYRWYRGLIIARVVKNVKHDPELGVIALISDISNEIGEREKLQVKSITDSLTGLHNRTSMDDKIEGWAEASDPCTVVFMDINDLKKTNDEQGHEAGDDLIKSVTSSMKVFTDAGFDVFRYGGDEFLAIGEDMPDKDIDRIVCSYLSDLEKKGLEDRVAYGVVHGRPKKELGAIIHAADSRMYDKKKAMKCERAHGK
ncbi:MAG: GGDEF domain-containing protein [Bacilli bacterium]|nr:GGDEF domain-containing protein [Bacilli bacterium]